MHLGHGVELNIVTAKAVRWDDDYGLSPTRVRTKAGTALTFKNRDEAAPPLPRGTVPGRRA